MGPAAGAQRDGRAFRLAGQLEPAYTVGGDHFDWSVDGDRLTVTVLNGDGTGLAAALLTAVTVNAMRNARRSGGGLVEQAELASDTVFYQHRGERYVATLLLEVDLASGRVRAVDAGSPHLLRMRGSPVRADRRWSSSCRWACSPRPATSCRSSHLDPGDRLFVVSDGVYAAGARRPGAVRGPGDGRVPCAPRGCSRPAEAVGTVMRELHAYHADSDLRDDAVVVCLDWHGPPRRRRGV